MAGITSHRPRGKPRGKGASFDSVADIAGRKFQTVLVMAEWKEGARISATSEGGIKLRATFVFEEFDDGTTDVTLVNEYEPPGVFRLMGGLVRSTVEQGVQQSLQDLKRMVEAETGKPLSRRPKKAP
jgi:uncharacterized membrane protein